MIITGGQLEGQGAVIYSLLHSGLGRWKQDGGQAHKTSLCTGSLNNLHTRAANSIVGACDISAIYSGLLTENVILRRSSLCVLPFHPSRPPTLLTGSLISHAPPVSKDHDSYCRVNPSTRRIPLSCRGLLLLRELPFPLEEAEREPEAHLTCP